MEKEIDTQEVTHKEFFIGVSYYSGNTPYPIINDNIEMLGHCDLILKVQLPLRLKMEDK